MRLALVILGACATALVCGDGHAATGFILADEPIGFDSALRPHFTEQQIAGSADATRAGFAMWAATPHGRKFISRFNTKEFRILIVEDPLEMGPGRAPQPPIATLIAAGDRSRQKVYEVILNPSYALPRDFRARLLSSPWQSGDVMAATWAAEMLHISFYADGVSLPHHGREDFQREWQAIAAELGFPEMSHGDPEERRSPYWMSSYSP